MKKRSMRILVIIGLSSLMVFSGCSVLPSNTDVDDEVRNELYEEDNNAIVSEDSLEDKANEPESDTVNVKVGRFEAVVNVAGNGAVEYGDTIKVIRRSYEVIAGITDSNQQYGNDEECEIVVCLDEGSEFTQWDWWYPNDDEYPMTDDDIQMGVDNVNAAIGKMPGEKFEISFEYGDGRTYYEYEILEIVKK